MTPTPTVSVGANLEWVKKQLGGEVQENDYNPTITTTSGSLLPNNPDRLSLVIFNLGANDFYVSFNPSVSSTAGWKVVAGGGFLVFKLRDDFTTITRQLYAVSTIGSTTAYITETVRIVKTGEAIPTMAA